MRTGKGSIKMALARAAIPESDRRFIIGRSAGCCNKCRTQVFRDNEFGEKARIGDDAHIWAYSEDGPRGRAADAPADRNARENIILLCRNCHAEVDQQPQKFTAAVLTRMREDHYEWADWCRGQGQVEKPRFHYILYLNVPRMDMYAVANSIALQRFDFGTARCFRDLGLEAGQVMASYTHVLNLEDIYADQIGATDDISQLEVGRYCFIEPTIFRTVGIGKTSDPQSDWELDKSVIYRRFADWRLICLIDPRWITTSTAGATLRSGQARLCGVVRINRVDDEARKIYASPLFLAQPEGRFSGF
jgi:hypothetical protein